jgi:hypothetical protein
MHLAVLYAPRAPAVPTGGLPVDKVVHVLAFGLPTAALIAAGVPRRWVVALLAAHAPISELLQHQLLADRTGEAGDIAADLAGVVAGVALTAVVGWPVAPHAPGRASR